MKYEIACTFCGHPQIYNPRGKKPPKKPHTSCKACAKDFSIDISLSEIIPRVPKNNKSVLLTPSTHKRKGLSKPTGEEQPTAVDDPVGQFIDDPDGILMDLSMNVLNRQRHELLKKGTVPSSQWALVLISVRKENIGKSKKEGRIRSQFKSMDIKDIAKISSGKQIDTSQKPDLKESS